MLEEPPHPAIVGAIGHVWFLSRDVDGTGLGLTFSRYIAKVHNGEIRVSSQLGGGSSFTLVLRKTPVLAE